MMVNDNLNDKQGILFYNGNSKLFDTEMKKRAFRDNFLGVRYKNVKDFCEALFYFSKISGISYGSIFIDYMFITKKEIKGRFYSDEPACIAICGTSSDFAKNKKELKKILDGWSSKNCNGISLCSLLAPFFSMSFKDRDTKLLYFRTKGTYAKMNFDIFEGKF